MQDMFYVCITQSCRSVGYCDVEPSNQLQAVAAVAEGNGRNSQGC